LPPTVKVTKENIVDAAVDIVRQNGIEAVNARSVASALGCSTQPIFSNYPTMEHLKTAVAERAAELYRAYLRDAVASNKWPPYKATGMGYIRFATEETELFKLLYMGKNHVGVNDADWQRAVEVQMKATGMSVEQAERFHLEMWVYVHGIAVMIATGYLSFDTDTVSAMLTDEYEGLKSRHCPCEKEEA